MKGDPVVGIVAALLALLDIVAAMTHQSLTFVVAIGLAAITTALLVGPRV
jgi:hypothetical protein